MKNFILIFFDAMNDLNISISTKSFKNINNANIKSVLYQNNINNLSSNLVDFTLVCEVNYFMNCGSNKKLSCHNKKKNDVYNFPAILKNFTCHKKTSQISRILLNYLPSSMMFLSAICDGQQNTRINNLPSNLIEINIDYCRNPILEKIPKRINKIYYCTMINTKHAKINSRKLIRESFHCHKNIFDNSKLYTDTFIGIKN